MNPSSPPIPPRGAVDPAPPAFALEEATIAGVHAAMRRGALDARSLVGRYLGRIEACDRAGPALRAVLRVSPRALADAAALDAEFARTGRLRPLHGVPLLLKDNVATAGLATTAGSPALRDHLPARDATIVARLREAGAIVLAKTNLHELAAAGETLSSLGGQTLNPYDPTRTPGGSSGGTGAALAADLGLAGIGTDTVNSIRSPASACALVGIRPTLGLVSRAGIVPFSLTQDTAGPMARSVADAARLLDAIAGSDPDDAATAEADRRRPASYADSLDPEGLAGARIGVLESFFGRGAEHLEAGAATRRAIDAMRARGATIAALDDDIDADELLAATSVHLHEVERDLDAWLGTLAPPLPARSLRQIVASGLFHPAIGPVLRRALELGADADGYRERLARRRRLQQRVLARMDAERLDALAFPHQRRLVAVVGQPQGERNGSLGAITGFPSIVVPAGFSAPTATAPLGVPVGIELLGRPWAEPVLIRLACGLEDATRARRPPLLPGC